MKIKLFSLFTSQRFIRFFSVLWILSIVVFVLTLLLGTNGFKTDIQSTDFGNSSYFLILLVGSMGIGFLTFGLLVLTIIVKIILEKKVLVFRKSFRGIFSFGFKLLILLATFPLFLLYRVSKVGELFSRIKKERFKILFLRPKRIKTFVIRLMAVIAISLTFLPVWIGGYVVVGTLVASQLGYVKEEINIVGTGSMYPTFPKGHGRDPKELAKEIVGTQGMLPYPNGLIIVGQQIFGHKVGKGDIVTFENESTRKATKETSGYEAGFLKRVIALAGDTIELKNGIVYLNGESLREPYTTSSHSTFGEEFLKECQVVTVPPSSFFAMGDNRKGSGDSREIGFASINDIDHVFPWNSQKGVLDKNYRDISKDLDDSSKIRLDKTKYLELLNEERKKSGLKSLIYQSKLEKSSLKRGEAILKYDDFSYEATKSSYTQIKAMNDAGYSNIVWNEGITQGYYGAEELFENLFEFPDWKENLLLDKDLQEIGISEVEGELNGCPAQVIVQHFAGYVPPNYKIEDIDSWRQSVNNLNSIIPSWENSKGKGWVDENDLSRLLNLFYRERTIASNILSKMEANRWLTKDEENSINEYNQLSQESAALANKLNERQ